MAGGSAVRAVESAFKVCEKRRRLPQWQDVDTTEPNSAIAAIHQTLNAFPEEIFDSARGEHHFPLSRLSMLLQI